MSTNEYRDDQLIYAATARCACGAGLAYSPTAVHPPFHGPSRWDCSDILTGRAVPSGQEGAKMHDEPAPFAFYKVKAEGQPSAAEHVTDAGDPLACWCGPYRDIEEPMVIIHRKEGDA